MAINLIELDNLDPGFTLTTDFDEVDYQLKFRFNTRMNVWVYDVSDAIGETIFAGIPFYTLVRSVLASVSQNSPKGLLTPFNHKVDFVDADRFAIGADVKLYYQENEN